MFRGWRSLGLKSLGLRCPSTAIKEGERLQKEIDNNQAAQAKNKELREFFTKMHEVAVEELKIENEIETRAFCLQTDLKTFSEYSKLTDRRYK